jgi:8-oxo-dGTP pyrophosphatase MutT (NUDIX family)
MLKEQSAGIVIFRKEGGTKYYLLLNYGSNSRRKKPFWDFSKGHIEKGEDEVTAALREAEEETGLKDIKILEGFKEKIRYFFVLNGNKISKTVVFFTGETREDKVKISFEHAGFKWLPHKEAVAVLTFRNPKNILKKAEGFIKNVQR